MAADGSVDFAVRLVNDVTRPAKQVQLAMADVRKAFEQTRSAVEAPSPRRSAGSPWDAMVRKGTRSQAADQAREQAKIVRLNALDQARAQKESVKQYKLGEKAKLTEAKRVDSFKKGMAQQQADHHAEVGDAVGSVAMGATAAVALAGVAAAAAIGALALKFGEAAIEAAAFGERSRMALTFLTGSAGQANEQFDSLRQEAASLGLDVERTQRSFQKLLAAQFDIGKSRELIRMGADLQAIGAKADDVEGVLLAITQIKSKGKLQAEEMLQLQERGISAELVYDALGKQMGKSKDQLMAMQKKGQLGGPGVIEAILEAVRHKTGVQTTGEAGQKFADTSLTGMGNVLIGRFKNFMIDVGDAILPGLTTIMGLIKGSIDSLMSDPELAAIGKDLLAKFDYFVLWVKAEWPAITGILVGGLKLIGDGFILLTELFDTTTWKGQAFMGVLTVLGVALGVAALGVAVLMAPLYLLIGVIGLVAYGIYSAVMWVVNALSALPKWMADVGRPGGSAPTTAPTVSLGGAGSSNTISTAADSGPSASVGGLLGSYAPEPVTVAAEDQSPLAKHFAFDFSGMQVGANVDTDDMVAKIRSEVTKAIHEAAA